MEKLFFEHFLVTVTKVFLMAFFLYLLIKPILKILKIRNSFRERALKTMEPQDIIFEDDY